MSQARAPEIGDNLMDLARMGLTEAEIKNGFPPGFNEALTDFAAAVFCREQIVTPNFFSKLERRDRTLITICVNGLRAAHSIQGEFRTSVIKGVLAETIRLGHGYRWFDLQPQQHVTLAG